MENFQYLHVIGGAGSGNGKFKAITGIAVDKKGYLHVVLTVFKSLGEFVSQFGRGGTAYGQLQWPLGLVLSQSEILSVCDSQNHRIQAFFDDRFVYSFGKRGS